jgi:acyl-coenzyme A thioesterase PaaI-like protein
MKASLFRHGINLWPPFLFSGIHVTAIDDDYRRVRVELRQRLWNMNYVRTHFGGSLFAMTDPFWMLCLLQKLGRNYVVWDKAGEVEFIRPGRGVVATEFHLDDGLVEEIKVATAEGGKHLRWFENEIRDERGELVARVRKQVYVRLKPRAR